MQDDAEHCGGLGQPAGGRPVGPARPRVAARMVVGDDHAGRVMAERGGEDGAHRQHDPVRPRDRVRVEREQPPLAVEVEDGEPFARQVGEQRREQGGRIAGGGDGHARSCHRGAAGGRQLRPFRSPFWVGKPRPERP